ncbi:CehA/McbA family metallohydrolase [Facklamia miroungae]|uniref:Polymerase/histidinol phosphatase N-terminal domain-containing protein n=1 Tax=Facklamia miroungae TaxID=120956 RepID=A0A1G7TAS4_9LACT|nr:CehA/McbA family metallohydrolase [Facklamia miroungae]NKZ29742.1 CehA/McbA family metallohydrolase [Facklamia miroungae]SDG32396.1 hypothetical protein SAMN05421791_10570 [Facklamia miroungae]
MTNKIYEIELLKQDFKLYHSAHQTHINYQLEVPEGATELFITFHYEPLNERSPHALERSLIKEGLNPSLTKESDNYRNLLTLSINDPEGFRGAHHYFNTNQEIILSEHSASLGFIAGPIRTGRWEIILSCHGIFSDFVEGQIQVRVKCGEDYSYSWGIPLSNVGFKQKIRDCSQTTGIGWSFQTIELHTHTNHSDAQHTTQELLQAAEDLKLDWLAISDHNTTSALYEAKDNDNYNFNGKIIPAIEFTTFFGHFLLHGPIDYLNINWTQVGLHQIDELLGELSHFPLSITIAHPFSPGNPYCTGCRWDYPLPNLYNVDAIEVWNEPNPHLYESNTKAFNRWVQFLDQGYEIAATVGHDWHRPLEENQVVARMYINLPEDAGDLDLIKSLQYGRSYSTLRPQFHQLTINDYYGLGDRIKLQATNHLDLQISGLNDDEKILIYSNLGLMTTIEFDQSQSIQSYRYAFTALDLQYIRLEVRNSHQHLIAFTNCFYFEL